MPWLLVLLLTVFLLLLSTIASPQDKVVFLDIGQGDAILLQEGTAQILIDGGAGRTVLTRLGEELPYFDRKIEVVIATHPDRDHLEGLLHVLEKYPVGLVVLPPVPHTSQLQEEWLTRLQAAALAKNVAYRFAAVGQELQVGELKIAVLGPPPASLAVGGPPASPTFLAGKTNNASVITRVDFGQLSLLLSGDAEVPVEQALVARTAASLLDVNVLKAGHHGSKTSTSQELLAATTPSLVAISVGKDNSFGHPHPSVLARLAAMHTPIVRTDEAGSIRFVWHEHAWLLSCGTRKLFTLAEESCTQTNS